MHGFLLIGWWWGNNGIVLLCIYLEVEAGHSPNTALLFSDCHSFFYVSFPYVISNCFDMPFGTLGRSGRQNEAYFLEVKNRGHRKVLHLEDLKSPAPFPSHRSLYTSDDFKRKSDLFFLYDWSCFFVCLFKDLLILQIHWCTILIYGFVFVFSPLLTQWFLGIREYT